jgi:monosaccharide-transporting ATPase
MAVVMISSEVEELVDACARVVILRQGGSVAEIGGDELTVASVVRAIAGDRAGPLPPMHEQEAGT